MNRRFRLALPIATVAALAACAVRTPYPSEWARTESDGTASCGPLNGTFDNFGDWAAGDNTDERLLAGLLFPLGTNEGLANDAERTAVSHVAFDPHDDGNVHASAWVGDELLFERTLTGRDLVCQEGRLLFRDSGWVVEGSIAMAVRVSSRYLISIAPDGSLVMEQLEAGVGLAFGVVPIASMARTWLRFAPFAPGRHSSLNSPRGVRVTAMPSYRLLLPEGAKKWSAYDQATDCIEQARKECATPLSTAEAARLGGRSTQAFLDGRRDGTLAPSGESHKTMGWVPATHDLRVEKLHWESPVTTDRYVFCLLDKGFRWEDGSP